MLCIVSLSRRWWAPIPIGCIRAKMQCRACVGNRPCWCEENVFGTWTASMDYMFGTWTASVDYESVRIRLTVHILLKIRKTKVDKTCTDDLIIKSIVYWRSWRAGYVSRGMQRKKEQTKIQILQLRSQPGAQSQPNRWSSPAQWREPICQRTKCNSFTCHTRGEDPTLWRRIVQKNAIWFSYEQYLTKF